jgi:hypothetical protein
LVSIIKIMSFKKSSLHLQGTFFILKKANKRMVW